VRKATRSPEYSTRPAISSSSSATRTARAEASAAPSQFVEGDWRRTEQGDDTLACDFGFVTGAVGRSARVVEFVAGLRSRRRLWIDPVQSLLSPKGFARLAACLAHDGKIVRAHWLKRRQHIVCAVQIEAPCFSRSLVPSARGSRGEPGTAKTCRFARAQTAR